MTHLARSSGSAKPAKHPFSAEPSHTVGVDGTQWNGPVLDIGATGLSLVVHHGPVIHSALIAQPGVRRGRSEQWYRSRVGWIAQQRGITVVRVRQNLSAMSDGRFRPAGEWVNEDVRHFTATGEPTRRIGAVAADEEPAATRNPAPTGQRAADRPQPPADLDYLPLDLRTGLATRASDPTVFEAEAVQFTRSDGSTYHSVGVIKINDREAACLLASRQGGSSTWQAEQVSFAFATTDDVAVPR
ncbi:MAG: hypothetical protein WBG36_11250 [Ornithinimicrobium sp.]